MLIVPEGILLCWICNLRKWVTHTHTQEATYKANYIFIWQLMWYTAWHAHSVRLTLSYISGQQSLLHISLLLHALQPTFFTTKCDRWAKPFGECSTIIADILLTHSLVMTMKVLFEWTAMVPHQYDMETPLTTSGPRDTETHRRQIARSANLHISCIIKTLVPTEQREGHFQAARCYKGSRNKPISVRTVKKIRVFSWKKG